MDNELLKLVVRAIPLVAPTTETDPTLYDQAGRIAFVKSPWKINFEPRFALTETISKLRKVSNINCICHYQTSY